MLFLQGVQLRKQRLHSYQMKSSISINSYFVYINHHCIPYRRKSLCLLHKYHILHHNTLLLPSCNCRLSSWCTVERYTLNRSKSHHRNFCFCKLSPRPPQNIWSFCRNSEISRDMRDLVFLEVWPHWNCQIWRDHVRDESLWRDFVQAVPLSGSFLWRDWLKELLSKLCCTFS